MKSLISSIGFICCGMMAFGQIKTSNVHVTSNVSSNSIGTTNSTNSYNISTNTTTTNSNSDRSDRDYTYTNDNTNNNSNNSSNNYSNSNNYNNSNNYSNSNNNSYSNYNNGYGNSYYNNNGYYNNGYSNNSYNSYSNNNSNQTSYITTDNSYGSSVVETSDFVGKSASMYNTTTMMKNYRNNTAIEKIFNRNQKPSQIFVINAQVQNTLKGNDGTIIKIEPNSFVDNNGNVVKGDVSFELKEVYQPGDMIMSNASTVSNDIPLVSGGEMYMGAEKNGEMLLLAQDKPILIEIPAAAGQNEPMQLFNGKPDRNTVNWNLASPDNVTPVFNSNSSTGQSYNFSTNSMNWLNCDRFIRNNNNTPMTKVFVNVPQQYDTTNTAVFIKFAGQNTVTKFDHFTRFDNMQNRLLSSFDTQWYSVPTGTDVTIVAISEIDGQVYSSIQRTTLVQNHMADLQFKPTAMDDFRKELDELP